ncbi:MAG: gliding motility-associated C-terminal domain-containing protein [Cyclobacteriaceae bacterium]|nr:gliding motility-associated C-terminal domain-containing protein [Cyclobacteriaceae bacterium]
MKSKHLFFWVFLGLTLFSAYSWAQAPVVTLTNKKDACRDLLDGSGNPGSDGILDNGSIIVTATSGIPPITLFILGPVNIVNQPLTLGVPFLVSKLKPGNYFVVVQDGNPSDYNGSFTINGTTDITASVSAGFPINSSSCGTPTGQISLDVAGGTGAYVYSWTATNGFTSSSKNISGLTAGDYSVVVSDNGTNCSQTIGPISILEPPAPSNAVLSLTGATPICAGGTSTIKVDVTGGSGPYSLSISGIGAVNGYTSGANITVSPLVNTTYTLTGVTDVNGCVATAVSGSATVNVNPVPVAPAITFTPNTYCVGQAIISPFVTTPAGGSTYKWYSDAALTTLLVTNATPTNAQLGFSNAAPNTTSVFVTERNSLNCEGPATTITLTVNAIPVAPAVTFTPSSYCVGNIITPPTITTPIGGNTYTWYSDVSLSTVLITGSSPTNAQLGFSSASANTKTVFVTEKNSSNCEGSATPVTLTVSAVPVAPSVTFNPTTYCLGATITPPVIGSPVAGSTYTWYSDAGLTSILTTGATPTNAQLSFSSASVNTTSVFVTETNSSNCVGPATPVTLTVNPIPVAPGVTFNPSTYCAGAAITPPVITAPVGGSTYTWYSDVSLSTVLTVGTAPTNAQLGFSSAVANTTNIFVTETNGSTCQGPATAVTLTVSAVPVAPGVTFTPSTYCVGSTITPPSITSPTGGSTYSWYSNAGLTTLLTTGTNPTNLQLGFSSASVNVKTVFVTETNTNTCTGPAQPVTLTVNAVPSAPSITFNPSTYCAGTAIIPPTVTTPVGGSTYTWYSDVSLSTILTTGTSPTNAQLGFSSASANSTTIFVTETNSSNCPGPATSLTLTVNSVPVAPPVTFAPSTFCVGQSINAPIITTPVGGSTYRWYSDAALTTLLSTGTNPTNIQLGFSSASANTKTVFVTETNSNNCSSLATSVTLTVNAVPVAPAITFSPTTYCVGSPITPPVITTPAGGSTYTWYSDATLTTVLTSGTTPTNAQINFSNAAAGVTSVFVTETNTGCTSNPTTVTLTVNALPTASITGSTAICNGQSTSLTIDFTGSGPWTFQYSDGATTFPGNSATNSTSLSVNPVSSTTYTLISVTDSNCSGTITGTSVAISVDNPPSIGLVVTASLSPVCSGGSSSIDVGGSENGVSYQLRDSGNNPIGSAIVGTGATISLPTGVLVATTTFNVLATRGTCPSVQLTSTATVTVVGVIDNTLAVTAQSLVLCEGSSTNIQVSNSESGVTYQLRNDADDTAVGASVAGTGGTINLPTGNLAVTTSFNILASNGSCSIELVNLAAVNVDINPDPSLTITGPAATLCVGGGASITISNSEAGVSYQLRNDADDSLVGASVAGTGASISLPTGALNTTTTFNVLATGGVCTPIEMTTIITINVAGSIDLSLTVTAQSTTFCAGNSTIIQVANSEVGVNYQLRNDLDDSNVLSSVAGTGGTIDLPTGNLVTTTTFNVFASNVTCAAELTTTVSVTVNPSPSPSLMVSALSNTICFANSTAIQVANSEVGVNYQLRDNSGNTLIGSAVAGTGSTLSLPTGSLVANTSFNVLAVIGPCSVQLTTVVSVNVLPNGDPSCTPPNNCATVIITPNTTLATCGAAVPDGTVTFDINPATPAVNIIGVIIEINGPKSATQFNNFQFLGLPTGLYTYIVTYGDAGNPACIKNGFFTINPTGAPDLVNFTINQTTYNCLDGKGSIILTNIIGTANTDFTYTVFKSGNVEQQGNIAKDVAASPAGFTINNIDLGDYEIQLSQDQSLTNGCVGFVNSVFKNAVIAEPAVGCGLIIPNIFTPNGDGFNDLLVILNLPASSKLSITNRWGKEVYSATDYQNNWNGGDVVDGLYYYRLVVNGEAVTGWIEILRGQ